MNKLIALTLYVFFCIPSGPIMAETEVYEAVLDSDGIQRVQITAGEYFFTPRHIVVRVNVPTEIIAKKEGGIVPHTITMNAPEAGLNFSESLSTEPVTIKFTPTKVGSFAFYCSKKLPFMKSHREKGMEGVIEVRE